jgi:hypothetical protein
LLKDNTITATTYTGALASAVTATTQAASDNSTKVATTAYVDTSSAAHDSLEEVLVVGNTSGTNNLIIDSGQVLTTNTINETTAASGVTIDSVLIKDNTVTATTYSGALASTVTATTQAASDNSTKVATTAYVDTSSAAHDSLPEVLVVGNTTGGTDLAVSAGDDITFTDTSKAIFGAGSDLQIYHDGSNSYVTDTSGTGDLYVRGTNLRLTDNDGTLFLYGANNAATTVYYAGSARLATTSTGIDVTGTATMDGLTVDVTSAGATETAATLKNNGAGANTKARLDFFAASTRYAGISGGYGASSPEMSFDISGTDVLDITSTGIDVTGTATMDGLTVDDGGIIQLTKNTVSAGDSLGIIEFHDEDGAATADAGKFQLQAFRGADKDAPDFKLIGSDAGGTLRTRLQVEGNGDLSLYEDTGTTPKFFWDSSTESLGIGNSSPQQVLHISQGQNATATALRIENTDTTINAAETANAIEFYTNDNSAGGTGVTGKISHVSSNAGNRYDLTFSTYDATSLSEAMRIDSAGNVLVGKTLASSATEGFEAKPSGFFAATRTNSVVGVLNRLSTDGDILDFRKAGTTVGTIGVDSGDNLFIEGSAGSTHSGLQFGTSAVLPHKNGTTANAVVDLGAAASQFKDLYLSGTATMDGLTVDGDASVITLNNTDTSLSLGQTLAKIDVYQNDASDQGVGVVASIEVENKGTIQGLGQFNFKTGGATSLLDRLSIAENGDISFYEDTGTTPKFFWDASTERLGIGTSTPVNKLHLLNAGTTAISNTIANSGAIIDGGSSNAALNLITGDAGFCYVNFGDSTDSNIGRIFYNHTNNSMVFSTNVSERMRITNAGNVGIGTSAPSTSKLHLQGSTGTASAVRVESTGVNSDAYYIADNDASVWTWGIDGGLGDAWVLSNAFGLGAPKMTVLTNGSVGIGTTSPDGTLHVHTGSAGAVTAEASANDLVIENSGQGGLSILTPDANEGRLVFGSPSSNFGAFVDYAYNSSLMRVGTVTVGATTRLVADNNVTNLTLSGASGSELATFAGDVTLSDGNLSVADASATTGDAAYINGSLVTTGNVLNVYHGGAMTSVGNVARMWNDNPLAVGKTVLNLTQDAAQRALYIDQNGAAPAIEVDGGGIKFTNATASGNANTLDDYEEGTHTATMTPNTSGTTPLDSTIDTLSYTKIGRVVTVTGLLQPSGISSAVGTYVSITLPFTSGNLSEFSGRTSGSVTTNFSGTTAARPSVLYEASSTLIVYLDASTIGNGTGGQFYINITYFT